MAAPLKFVTIEPLHNGMRLAQAGLIIAMACAAPAAGQQATLQQGGNTIIFVRANNTCDKRPAQIRQGLADCYKSGDALE